MGILLFFSISHHHVIPLPLFLFFLPSLISKIALLLLHDFIACCRCTHQHENFSWWEEEPFCILPWLFSSISSCNLINKKLIIIFYAHDDDNDRLDLHHDVPIHLSFLSVCLSLSLSWLTITMIRGPKFDLMARAKLYLSDANDAIKTHDLMFVTGDEDDHQKDNPEYNMTKDQHPFNHHQSRQRQTILTSGSSTIRSTSLVRSGFSSSSSQRLPLFGHFCCRLAVKPNSCGDELLSGYLKIVDHRHLLHSNQNGNHKSCRTTSTSTKSSSSTNKNGNNHQNHDHLYWASLRNFQLSLWIKKSQDPLICSSSSQAGFTSHHASSSFSSSLSSSSSVNSSSAAAAPPADRRNGTSGQRNQHEKQHHEMNRMKSRMTRSSSKSRMSQGIKGDTLEDHDDYSADSSSGGSGSCGSKKMRDPLPLPDLIIEIRGSESTKIKRSSNSFTLTTDHDVYVISVLNKDDLQLWISHLEQQISDYDVWQPISKLPVMRIMPANLTKSPSNHPSNSSLMKGQRTVGSLYDETPLMSHVKSCTSSGFSSYNNSDGDGHESSSSPTDSLTATPPSKSLSSHRESRHSKYMYSTGGGGSKSSTLVTSFKDNSPSTGSKTLSSSHYHFCSKGNNQRSSSSSKKAFGASEPEISGSSDTSSSPVMF